MSPHTERSALVERFFRTRISVFELWVGYAARGGGHTYPELLALLAGEGHWSERDRVIAAALLDGQPPR